MFNRSSSFDVAVVGGGVIGLAVAWRAAQRGLRVAILERAEPGRATSWVAAGMLAPVTEASLSEQPVLQLALHSARAYPSFVSELEEASQSDPGYLHCGTLLAAADNDQAEALTREEEVRESLGLPVERLRPSDARRLEPALAPSLRLALAVPGDHAIDPRKLTVALAEAVRRTGAELRVGAEVTGVVLAQGRVQGVQLVSGERVSADQVVVAAGAWSSKLEGIPEQARIPLHPIKGQILRLHDPAGPGLLTRVLRMSGGYVVPRGDGRYVLGATMEERGFDTTVTAGAVFGLLREVSEILPAADELVIDELAAGLRPGTPDNRPVIGPGAVPGLNWATGHYRNGILLAPSTAEIIVSLLTGDEPAELAAAFSPSRFSKVPLEA